jgi:endonuclease/exonuclease/phosphatase (EEP) superfamily protein YafD
MQKTSSYTRHHIFSNLACAGALLTVILALLSYLDRVNWLCYLLCQFRVQYALALLGFIGLMSVYRRPWLAFICVVILAADVITLAPNLFAKREAVDGKANLRLLLVNVNYKNSQYLRVINYIADVNADVVILEEFTPKWQKQVEESLVEKTFPYKILAAREDTFGIAVFSRFPIVKSQILGLAGYEWPTIVAQISPSGNSLNLVAAHFMGPMTYEGWLEQVAQMRDLGARSEIARLPLVVAGDFNTTPWTDCFCLLMQGLHLRDSRRGFGLQQSWPTAEPIVVLKSLGLTFSPYLFGLNALVALPLDHCLVSDEIIVANRRVGNFVGSDHFPVVIDLILKEPPSGTAAGHERNIR